MQTSKVGNNAPIITLGQQLYVVPLLTPPNVAIGTRIADEFSWVVNNDIGTLLELVSSENRLYLIGGRIEGTFSTTVRSAALIDGRLGVIEDESQLVLPRALSGAVILGDQLIVVGGLDGAQVLSSIEIALMDPNGHVGEFSLVGALPEPVVAPRFFVDNEVLYVLGSRHVFYHDIQDGYDVWQSEDLPDLMVSGVVDPGGFIAIGFDTDQVFDIRIAQGQIRPQDLAPTPDPEQQFSIGLMGDDLYLIGGPLETDSIDFPDTMWTANVTVLRGEQ